MPRVLFRLLAVLLLALSLPLQGMASVTSGLCMTLAHHQESAGQENHEHAQEAPDGHAHSDASGVSPDDAAGNSAHCGPCTACCASASIAGPSRLLICSSASTTKYVFSQLPPRGVQPHGLDRPPLAL
jgi:hypothetical protein